MICQKPKLSALLAVVCLLLPLSLTACQQESPAQSSSNPSLQITLRAAPDGVKSDYQIVQVVDQAGQPVTDATVCLEGNMDHGGWRLWLGMLSPKMGLAITIPVLLARRSLGLDA